jgi:hypothetical protein
MEQLVFRRSSIYNALERCCGSGIPLLQWFYEQQVCQCKPSNIWNIHGWRCTALLFAVQGSGSRPWIDDDRWEKQMFRGLTDAEVWCQNARSPPQHVVSRWKFKSAHLNEMFGLNKKTFGLALIPQSCLRLASEIRSILFCHLGGGAKNDATTIYNWYGRYLLDSAQPHNIIISLATTLSTIPSHQQEIRDDVTCKKCKPNQTKPTKRDGRKPLHLCLNK